VASSRQQTVGSEQQIAGSRYQPGTRWQAAELCCRNADRRQQIAVSTAADIIQHATDRR